MEDQEIQRLQKEEQNYWWHISRRLILQSVLARHAPFCHPGPTGQGPSSDSGSRPGFRVKPGMTKEKQPGMTMIKILDVGCGTGENFKWLQDFGEVMGVDSSEAAVELANSAINHLGRVLLGRAEDLPVEDREFGLVTAFDVLEHVADEPRVLGEWGRVLSSGGLLFLSVPAYQSLFGPHDRALDHLRRYNLPQLKEILQNNGFHIVFSSYIFCLTFPLFWLQRTLVKKSSQTATQYVAIPKLINGSLIGLGKIEAWWLSFARFPCGSSIVVLAQKND